MKSTTDRRLVLLALVLVPAALAYACSGDDTVLVVDAGTAETYVPPPPPPPIDAARDTSTVDSGPKFDAGSNLSASNLLINEVSGGDEWVELVNIGADPEDISGIRLADRDKTTGEPKLSEAVMFPPSTVVQKGGYVIVRGGGTGDAGRPCPDGGQSHCFNAEFGIRDNRVPSNPARFERPLHSRVLGQAQPLWEPAHSDSSASAPACAARCMPSRLSDRTASAEASWPCARSRPIHSYTNGFEHSEFLARLRTT